MFRMTSAAVLLCASIALGQQPDPKLTFEVASIKPAAPQAMRPAPGERGRRSRNPRSRPDPVHRYAAESADHARL